MRRPPTNRRFDARRVNPTALKLRVLALLAESGPISGEEAAARLDVTLEAWWAAVGTCCWFAFDQPGPAGWTLTELGVAQLLATTVLATPQETPP